MIGKNLLYKRSVMIAVAVIALMTLTAGVAAATANKARFDASGSVLGVGLPAGGIVESKFKIDNAGLIKRVNIHTIGEVIGGSLTTLDSCTGNCADLAASLLGSVFSTHESNARLEVTFQPAEYPEFPAIEAIGGNLRGRLKANLTVVGGGGPITGAANLEIESTGTAYYACFTGAAPSGFGSIQDCIEAPGPHSFMVSTGGPAAGPVLLPIELHVMDSGRFNIQNGSVEINGRLAVTVDSLAISGLVNGEIVVTEGKAQFGDD